MGCPECPGPRCPRWNRSHKPPPEAHARGCCTCSLQCTDLWCGHMVSSASTARPTEHAQDAKLPGHINPAAFSIAACYTAISRPCSQRQLRHDECYACCIWHIDHCVICLALHCRRCMPAGQPACCASGTWTFIHGLQPTAVGVPPVEYTRMFSCTCQCFIHLSKLSLSNHWSH